MYDGMWSILPCYGHLHAHLKKFCGIFFFDLFHLPHYLLPPHPEFCLLERKFQRIFFQKSISIPHVTVMMRIKWQCETGTVCEMSLCELSSPCGTYCSLCEFLCELLSPRLPTTIKVRIRYAIESSYAIRPAACVMQFFGDIG
jgi:hypothetical protein